jgi:uncharacterized protein YndB with AHSA1/START domain
MRYADGPTVTVDLLIDAPPERVWALVTDIDLPARFSSEFQGATWIDETTFRGRNHHDAIGDWETMCFVVERDEPRVFAYAVSDAANPSATWRFTLTPEGAGTRVAHGMRMGPAPSGLSPAIAAMPDKEDRIIARRLDEHRFNMLATLEGIKGVAESGK